MEKWKDYILKKASQDEVYEKWLPNYYEENRPTKLINHLYMLKECGFSYIDDVFKYYNFTVYMGKK